MKSALLAENLTVSGQLTEEDIADLALRGVRTIINVRPDGEASGQLPAAEAARIAREHGIDYRHIPVTMASLAEQPVAQFAQAVREAQGPVHAHCRSGLRAATLWGLGQVLEGRLSREEARAHVAAAGFDLTAGLPWLDHQTRNNA